VKEKELSVIISQLNKLLLECNTLMCDNGAMEDAEKIYGFELLKIDSNNYKNRFYYAVRYKDPQTNKWLRTKTSTRTDDKIQARSFAITNKEEIIKKYKEHTKKLHEKNDGKEFYKMLEEYYTTDSKYLKDDYINNEKKIPKNDRIKYINVIKNYFIPYFKENKIKTIQEITRPVYSNIKLHLQSVKNEKGETLKTKTINNYLIPLNRILKYHERNELILRLPYSPGGGLITPPPDEEVNSKKPAILPTDNLKGIFEITIKTNSRKENTLLYYMLALMGLTTGMRDSEIGRIKGTDLIPVKDNGYFYLKAYNHKTEYYNRNETDKYRKIPLHPFVVEMLKHYIKEKKIGKDDYLFGIPKLNEDTKQIDGYLHFSKVHKAIIFLYRQIKFRENLNDKGEVEIPFDEELEKEMNEKRIVFYSLRHTFTTLCGLYTQNYNGLMRNEDLIDYFTGHNSGGKMRANYTQINSVDNKTFYDNYGKFVISMLDKFIFTTKEDQKKNEALDKYVDKFMDEKIEKSLDKDGNVDYETGIKVIEELINTLRKKPEIDNKNDEYDFFTTI
jgi:integrase